MKRRQASTVGTVTVGVLLLAACTGTAPQPGPDPEPSATLAAAPAPPSSEPCLVDAGIDTTAAGEIVTSAGEEGFLGYNAHATGFDTAANEAVVDRVLGGFWYRGADGGICPDEEFGTYEVVSADPLQVEYTIADGAVWSDGVPVTYADFLLEWAAQAITAEGAVVDSVTDGATSLFDHAAGLALGDDVPAGPQAASAGSKEFRYDYERVDADWESAVGAPLPAHVVAAQVGVTVEELVAAIQELDLTVLEPAAAFWDTGWSTAAGRSVDPALTPSSGPYAFTGDPQDGQVTLTANERYWGTPAATEELTFRSIAADTLVGSLQEGRVDVIQPPATVENLTRLEQVGSSITVSTGPTLTAEHLDFNFRQGVFADSLEAREAFALCVPRQQILDELIRPLDPDAVVMNAREVYPFQDDYTDVVGAAYDNRYDEVDLDLAAERFAAAGLEPGTQVRVSYPAPNQRRAEQVALIKSSCDLVGFDVVDAGDPDFYRSVLYAGAHDVALFAWVGDGSVAGGSSISVTGGVQNYGGYSDPVVDEAWATLTSTLDEGVQLEQTKVVEKQLWDTLYSIPLFAHPGLDAYRSELANVRPSVTRPGTVWSSEQWTRRP